MNYQSKVREFQFASGQPIDLKRELTKDELDFRDSLLREEIRELREAIVDNNRVEILDALCDIKYVNDGTANMMGVDQNDLYLEEQYYDDLSFSVNYFLSKLDNVNVVNVCYINEIIYCLSYKLKFHIETLQTALTRVHYSNMSKFCNDVPTAERTREFYAKQGIDTYIEPKEKKFVVYRQGDGKVLKSVEYYPVYLNDLI